MMQDTMSPTTPSFVETERILATATALGSAAELGVLDSLERGVVGARAISRVCGLTPRGSELLLNVLAALGWIDRESGAPREASSLASLRELVRNWAGLSAGLRGERTRASVDTRAGSEALYPGVVPMLSDLFAEAASRAAAILAFRGGRILDLGAGAAPWSIAIARRQPAARVTAVDFPAVLVSTRHAVEAAGLEDRYELVPGDALSMAFELRSYDLVLIANLCRLFGEESNRRLIARARAALRPRGSLAIVDVLPDEKDERRPAVALYALGLMLRTESGGIYPYTTFARWLDESGLNAIMRHELAESPPLSLIVAGEAP